jgi:hypothetical protein
VRASDGEHAIISGREFEMTSAQTIKLLHYHITNLDSVKIDSDAKQVQSAAKILEQHDIDILSLNGIQYDFKDVPTKDFNTTGLNLSKLLKKWNLRFDNHFFTPSNLGMNAKTRADGSYVTDTYTPEAMTHADDLNFGTVPGQLSTGGAFKYALLDKNVYTDLLWKDFNPNVDFSRFKTPSGAGFPEEMKLFDKSFSDVTLDVGGKRLHIILLHAAPSYHFGNPHSINSFRNAEQLRFLEWYVSGTTDHGVNIPGIKPLQTSDYYIIAGDLNTDINNNESEGASVLRSILKKSAPWMSPAKMTFTNEATHFGPNPFRLILDYIIVSKNIEILQGKVIYPDFTRTELGCEQRPSECPEGKSIVTYKINESNLIGGAKLSVEKDNRDYYAMIDDEYLLFKDTSYHYPVYGEFKLR